MGYTTDFSGRFTVTPPLSAEHVSALKKFADERHSSELAGSYYCQWVPTDDGTGIEWDGGEKFYAYESWLQYLIDHFLKPWGHVVEGVVEYQGEDPSDFGRLRVDGGDYVVKKPGRRVW